MIKKSHLATLLAASLSLAATEALATVYKWKDEKGVTHYTETPPPDSVKVVEKLKIKNRASSDADDAIEQLNKGRDEQAKKSAETPEKPAPNTTSGETKKEDKYKERCAKLKKDMETLKTYDTVNIQEGSGKERTLSAAEKADQIDSTQREIKAFCQ